VVDNENDSTFITSLFVVMGASILTASMAVFPVYERRNNSKHLQMVSGINKVAYWICHWVADLAQMMLPLAAIMIIFAAFNIDQYKGQLTGVFVLVLCFIISSIPYSHLVGFYFMNEFYAFVGQVGMNLFLGIITTSVGIVIEGIKDLNDTTKAAHAALMVLLPCVLPHYSLGKGLSDLGQNKLNGSRLRYNAATQSLEPIGVGDWSRTGAFGIGDEIGFLIGLGALFAILVLVLELSEGQLSTLFARLAACNLWGGNALMDDDNDAEGEDEDVAAERARVEAAAVTGFAADRLQDVADRRDGVILHGISKTFGVGKQGKKAVRSLAVGMPRGQCFGLLGINGAGKTSTFRMITGEFAPTSGDTRVLVTGGGKREYLSVHKDLSRARQTMGYCPQFDGLQPNMTAREHLQFYAQVRGVPDDLIDQTAEELLTKMSLTKYADRQAGTYSGGNKRKLSVAIALIGEPAVVLLDEPSTGMDPEARRFMWDVISASTKGRTIVLTSHSMEECEAGARLDLTVCHPM
jgi:ABC-type Na+ transport system ATPase subunit NatA